MENDSIKTFNNDCLKEMKNIEDKSIDLIFCDLPYGQTSCKWDCKIDLNEFWKQVMRIKKTNTPIFFTTTTKFGVELIQSAPKKCPFRYDIVWCKSVPAGFLLAKKMPLRKHEMIYVFYEKLPFYDLSSHTHKFVKEVPTKRNGKDGVDNKGMIKNRSKSGMETQTKYDPPLPVSVVKEKGCYGEKVPNSEAKYGQKCARQYDPPLPHSMLEIKSTRGKHSTEKPVALMEWILKYYSKEGDTILDPTMGSGSTGVACKNMNRKFIGIEMDEDIYKVACDRLK
jgi:site-specific DNA-methyltransferase (adenine-specific)